jgi:hypothetical protein
VTATRCRGSTLGVYRVSCRIQFEDASGGGVRRHPLPRAYLAPLPLREERDAVPADMQTTNRYEHSLDSAIRPVRPDGISRRTREHPCDARSGEGASLSRASLSRGCAPRRPGLHDHCGVSVKTSSETESVATRPHRSRERSIPPGSTPVEALSDPGLRVLPSPSTNEISGAAGEGVPRSRRHLLALPRGEASAPTGYG